MQGKAVAAACLVLALGLISCSSNSDSADSDSINTNSAGTVSNNGLTPLLKSSAEATSAPSTDGATNAPGSLIPADNAVQAELAEIQIERPRSTLAIDAMSEAVESLPSDELTPNPQEAPEAVANQASDVVLPHRPGFASGVTSDDFVASWIRLGGETFSEVESSFDEVSGSVAWTGHLHDSVTITLLAAAPSSPLSELYIQFPNETLTTASSWMQTLGTALSIAAKSDSSFGMMLILEAFERGEETGKFAGAAGGIEFCMVQDPVGGADSDPGWTIRIIASANGEYCQP